MTFTFICQSCDDSFEMDYTQLAESTKGLKCPNCGKRLPAAELDEFVGGVDEVLSQVAALRKRFVASFDVDADDLPAPYDSESKRAQGAEDEDTEDDVSDEDEEPELDDDEDRY